MYLQRRQTGIYYFRLPVPKDLKILYGKNEFCFSLKTTNKAEARLRSLPLLQNFLQEFQEKRTGKTLATSSVEAAPKLIQHSQEKTFFTFHQVYQRYLNERKLRERSRTDFNTIISRFLKICGDRDIASYTRNDIILLKDTLLKFPSHLCNDDSLLTPDEIIRKYEESRAKKISPATIRDKYLAVLKAVFNYALCNEFILSNPANGVRVIVPPKVEPARLPYNLSQIQGILSSALFKERQDDKLTEYRWIILLGIYTGARLEEICRLKVADYGEEDGIPFIFIRPDIQTGHNLKTASSRRRVPLHSRLIEFGFHEYLEQRKKERDKYIFPVMNRGKTVGGAISHAFSKWYGRYLSEIGLSDKKLTFHSFRHSFKMFGRQAGIEKTLLDCLQGHKNHEISLDYGKDEFGSPYSLKTLSDALEKIPPLKRFYI